MDYFDCVMLRDKEAVITSIEGRQILISGTREFDLGPVPDIFKYRRFVGKVDVVTEGMSYYGILRYRVRDHIETLTFAAGSIEEVYSCQKQSVATKAL